MPIPAKRPSKQAIGTGLKTVFRICQDKWGLSNDELLILLGSPSERSFFNWKKEPEKANLSNDQVERVSYLLNIHSSLRILFSNSLDSTYSWIKKPNQNPLFSGRSALDIMLDGKVVDLFKVGQYLNAQRGTWG